MEGPNDKKEAGAGRILLNMQMIADELTDMGLSFLLNPKDRKPGLRGFALYNGQKELVDGVLYAIARGRAKGFPVDSYPYITSENIFGLAAHIRSVGASDLEIVNAVARIFERYHRLETELNSVLIMGGSLNDLCRVSMNYFHNPVYVHDRMFTVLALPEYRDGMLEFERSEDGSSTHVPLWVVNNFKFDEAYNETLTKREAGIWEEDQFPGNLRSLYANIWDGDNYLGRFLVNEIDTPIRPGQFRFAEIFTEYIKVILQRDMQLPRRTFRDYEDAVRTLIRGGEPNQGEVNSLQDTLGWREDDSYIFLMLQSQNPDIQIRSDAAFRNRLASCFPGNFYFFHEQRLCMIINTRIESRDGDGIKAELASLVRDSYMFCGISSPIPGLSKMRTGFLQADITLRYIEKTRDRWLLLFSECALDYMINAVIEKMPAMNLVSIELLKLRETDREKKTDYYNTLRTYLQCERSIPRTSEALIIHRTTLQYRLEKIDQLTHLNLDSEDVRVYLIMSFKILEYTEKA